MEHIRETIERALDTPSRLEEVHAANVDGQHDELDTIDECGECDRILGRGLLARGEGAESELELRAAWGDR